MKHSIQNTPKVADAEKRKYLAADCIWVHSQIQQPTKDESRQGEVNVCLQS